MFTDHDLIPATPELNRLKDFLKNFKKPTLRYTGEDHMVIGLTDYDRAIAAMHERHQDWIDLLKGGPFPKV